MVQERNWWRTKAKLPGAASAVRRPRLELKIVVACVLTQTDIWSLSQASHATHPERISDLLQACWQSKTTIMAGYQTVTFDDLQNIAGSVL